MSETAVSDTCCLQPRSFRSNSTGRKVPEGALRLGKLETGEVDQWGRMESREVDRNLKIVHCSNVQCSIAAGREAPCRSGPEPYPGFCKRPLNRSHPFSHLRLISSMEVSASPALASISRRRSKPPSASLRWIPSGMIPFRPWL